MATYTSHYNLKKPATSDKIRIADFNGNADTIDATMYENATLGAQLKADIGIVENTNTATHNISAGQYVIWKGSLYTASSAISSGATLSDANLTAVSGGGLNALNGKITNLDGSIPYAECDANSYTTTGIYHVGITSNSPTGSAIYGDLFVQGTGQRVTQMFTIFDGTTYVRQRSNATTWNAWQQFALGNLVSLLGYEYLSSATDFNDLITTSVSGIPCAKHYRGDAISIHTNAPVYVDNTPFSIDVIPVGTYRRQILYLYGSSVRTFCRNSSYQSGGGQSWTAWKEISTTSVQ